MKNYEYEMLRDSVNIVLERLEDHAKKYRQQAEDFTDHDAKLQFEWLANGVDEAVRIITKVLPMKREHVEVDYNVPSEASATSVA